MSEFPVWESAQSPALDGHYNFTVDVSRAGGRSVDLIARYIGHKPKRLPLMLTVGRVEKNFDLEKDVMNLEQIVVTGVSGETSQKNTAFSVAVVDATALKEAPGITPLASLSGKVAGASVVTVSGQPGAPPAIRLRSPASISGTTDPLIIVDGTISRLTLADIASEDIERVEVIKGAAASSLYGSDAANGVVQIFTKRGASLAEGQSSLTVRNEYGQNTLPRTKPNNLSHAYKILPNGDFRSRRERKPGVEGRPDFGQLVPADVRSARPGLSPGHLHDELRVVRPAPGREQFQRVVPEHEGRRCAQHPVGLSAARTSG